LKEWNIKKKILKVDEKKGEWKKGEIEEKHLVLSFRVVTFTRNVSEDSS
jgi:hypothetical protein